MQERDPILNLSLDSETSFGNTDWWIVRQAGRTDEPDADPARSRLCSDYWKPIFHFIRRSGYAWHDAQDLTQEFFSRLLKRNSLRTAVQEKGRFRSFLLVLLKRFLADKKDWDRCKKRGGGVAMISFDQADTEFRCRIEPQYELDPEKICERRWVDSVLQQGLAQLEQECISRGKESVFQFLRAWVTGESEMDYAVAASRLHLSEATLRVTVHRLRFRLRQLLTEALIASGVATPGNGQELLEVYT
jgi:RNA polymerase sigma-70 factor (ECF subfamily)